MVRIQLHLTEQQDRRLRSMAKARSTTRAELIRQGIEMVLASEGSGPSDPLLALIGAAGPGAAPDVAERHDEVLYRAEPVPTLAAAEPKRPLK